MNISYSEIVAYAVTLPPEERQALMLKLRDFANDYAFLEGGDWLRKYSVSATFKGDPKTQLMRDLQSARKL